MRLETDRLVLREYEKDDWRMLASYAREPRFGRFYEPESCTDLALQALVQSFVRAQRGDPRIHFQLAVCLKESRELIGSVGIRERRLIDYGQPDASAEGEIGYDLNPAYWGQGYATEAAQAIVEFGFERRLLHRIWAWCVADNQSSVRVLERVGFQAEAHLRQNHWLRNGWWDTLVFGLLEDDWRARRV